jgi:[acyl-carrier-protein] S-malonyltransferase
MKYAIIFPGQGSQSLGMLSELADNFPVVHTVFSEASDALNLDLWALTQKNLEVLNQTQNTQPAMLAAGFSVYKILSNEVDLSPTCFAGHSLGEYTALLAANSLSFSDGVKLVRKRAELMQSAVPEGVGAMAAILGLEDNSVLDICAQYSGAGVVEAVNFNANGQVVIAGNKVAVEATCEAMKSQGAKRAVMLPVSVPSHCSLMAEAATAFSKTVEATTFQVNTSVLHNVDGKKANSADEIKTKLVLQLHKPVLWTKTVHNIAKMGTQNLIELGPGKILTGLTKRIDKSLNASSVFDIASLKNIIEKIKE